jgi:hypothetical protein
MTLDIRKTAYKGKWFIGNWYCVRVSLDKLHRRSKIQLSYDGKSEEFIINGHGRKAVENVLDLINMGCFQLAK